MAQARVSLAAWGQSISVFAVSPQEPLHFAVRLRATAGLGPDRAASEPKIMRSLQRPPKRTQGETHQVMR